MRFGVRKVAPLLFFSGACALVYQVAWLRDLRQVFGASTAASAAVLGVFMAGLGLGGVVIGKRADRAKNPLELYAHLEILVAVSSAISPFLVGVARWIYLALGGQSTLGNVGATVARLLLGALVLLVPTTLMGGTMPAAARAIASDADEGRRGVSALYGVNTFGAVLGALAANFVLLEVFGTRLTLWLVCLVNVLVGLTARMVSRSPEPEDEKADDEKEVRAPAENQLEALPPETDPSTSSRATDGLEGESERPEGQARDSESEKDEDESPKVAASDAPVEALAKKAPEPVTNEPDRGDVLPAGLGWFASAAAAVVGFAFLLMELVWYRMLAPLLGGSSYTFGLILAVALLGIGIGGAAYATGSRVPTLRGFALTCGLEALFVALPFAAGDRIALLALALRPLRLFGFGGGIVSWTVVCAVVVLPASIVAGLQFPLLIGLFGRGSKKLGSHVGIAYAANTAGSIIGSVSGGFGLMPVLTALGCWKVVVYTLAVVALVAVFLSARHESGGSGLLARGFAACTAAFALLCFTAVGPTAVWRHTPIGAGRADGALSIADENALEAWRRRQRASIAWEAEGLESTVALGIDDSVAFIVNGKIDGNTRGDAPTQVMSGLLGALLHPAPRKAMVIGLGTGSTAGWLGAIPEMERVDVVELEPAIVRVARDCADVNQHVLDNPKVRLSLGDAREVLFTSHEKYDIVFSEPSNPYRAGISSMFTREFYEAVRRSLASDGIFVKWVQSYEVDASSLHTVLTTLGSVFPSVNVWESMPGDLLLVARNDDRPVNVDLLRKRLGVEPFRTASRSVWHGATVETVLAHFVARDDLVRGVIESKLGSINRDDHNSLEFVYARNVGHQTQLADQLKGLARTLHVDRPGVDGSVRWERVDELWWLDHQTSPIPNEGKLSPQSAAYFAALAANTQKQHARAMKEWRASERTTWILGEALPIAISAVTARDPEAEKIVARLEELSPTDAHGLRAELLASSGRIDDAVRACAAYFLEARAEPWANLEILRGVLVLAETLATTPERAQIVGASLEAHFSVYALDRQRREAGMRIATRASGDLCVKFADQLEPNFPWSVVALQDRVDCYTKAKPERVVMAEAELAKFLAASPLHVGGGKAD